MRILHIDLAGAYTEGLMYQENILSDINAQDGHDVMMVASCYQYENGRAAVVEPVDKRQSNGVRLIRLEYDNILGGFISGRVRKASKLASVLEEFAPDVILFHSCAGWELMTVAKYKKTHPKVRFYADTHADFNNSSQNFLSKHVLHGLFYKWILCRAYPWIDRVFYVSEESGVFLKKQYKLPEDKLEFYPLGGIIHTSEKRAAMRAGKRAELGLRESDILICHSGKLDALKRTKELLTAFSKVSSNLLKLIIIGSVSDEMKPVLEPLIAEDERVKFLGWKSGEELSEYLCACDMYAQPGSQSATMQNAICCGAPVMLYPHISHKVYMRGNGYFVKNIDDMAQVFRDICDNPGKLTDMSQSSLKVAKDMLDYHCLAARLYK